MRLMEVKEFSEKTKTNKGKQDPLLDNIEANLATCKTAYEGGGLAALSDALADVIGACDTYLLEVDVEKRQDMAYFGIVMPILKQAVCDFFIVEEAQNPEVGESRHPSEGAFNPAQARWQMLRNLFAHENKNQPLALLDEEYHKEFHFKGLNQVAAWLEDENSTQCFSEAQAAGQRTGVSYTHGLSMNKERVNYHVNIVNGLLKQRRSNQFFDTADAKAMENVSGIIYAMDRNGNLYTSPPDVTLPTEFHHSTFLNGVPVLCAGELEVSKGQITRISNESGHYKPSKKQILQLLQQLQDQGVDLSKAIVKVQPNQYTYNAARYLELGGACIANELKAKSQSNYKIDATVKDIAVLIEGIDIPEQKNEALLDECAFIKDNKILTHHQKCTLLEGLLEQFAIDHPKYEENARLLKIQLHNFIAETNKLYDDVPYSVSPLFEYNKFKKNILSNPDYGENPSADILLKAAAKHILLVDVPAAHDCFSFCCWAF